MTRDEMRALKKVGDHVHIAFRIIQREAPDLEVALEHMHEALNIVTRIESGNVGVES